MAGSPQQQSLSQTSINDLGKNGVLTQADIQQVLALNSATHGTTRQFDPWRIQNEADQGTLWLGTGVDPRFADLPATRPQGNKGQQITYLGNTINLNMPDYGPDVTAELHTSWGHLPTAAQLRAARKGKNVPDMWIDIKDKSGKTIHRHDLAAADRDYIIGGFPGRRTDPGMHEETLQGVAGPGQPAKPLTVNEQNPNLTLTLDPYSKGFPQSDRKGLVADELKKLYTLEKQNPELLRRYKTELFLSGMYGNNAKLGDVDMGSITDADISAFGEIMMDASRYFSAGQKVTWQQLLSMRASDPAAKHRAAQSEPIIPLSDPMAITTAANDAGTKILGRAPTSQDLQTLIGFVHNAEHKYGAAQNAGGGVDVNQVNPQADIEQWMRQKYPNEAMAVDWGAAAQDWEQMLASTSPQPRIVGGANG